jgi:integrase
MNDSRSTRKTRSDKFPLTLHKTGQYCKKIRGKLYYFGADKQEALKRYQEQATYLHTGVGHAHPQRNTDLSLRVLCNLYLDHQGARQQVGDISPRHFYDQKNLLRGFARYIGANRSVSDVTTLDLQDYKKKLINAGKNPNTINNRIAAVKAMFHWAIDNEVIDRPPNLKALKKVPSGKRPRQTFTPTQINLLLKHASVQMKAMIWLALNCGFGCTDCAQLAWRNLDLKKGRVNLPRGKTGVTRDLVLWPETIEAIESVSHKGECVFYTRRGNPWVGPADKTGRNRDTVSSEFSKLMQKAGIQTEKGAGFYTLRRTAATLAAQSQDPFAVQKLLGHADLKMATVYVQDVSEQTDRVVNNVRKLIVQGDSSPSGTGGQAGEQVGSTEV